MSNQPRARQLPQLGFLEGSQDVAERRTSSRRRLLLEASGVTAVGIRIPIVVHDISRGGMLLETSQLLRHGEELEVILPQAGPIRATVVWSTERFFGCEFGAEVSAATVSAVVLLGRSNLRGVSGHPQMEPGRQLDLLAVALQKIMAAIDRAVGVTNG